MTVQSLKTSIITAILAAADKVFPQPTTAADDVAAALAGFTEAADKLEAAGEKAWQEEEASWDRQEAAEIAFEELRTREYNVREAARLAGSKARHAADKIRALVS